MTMLETSIVAAHWTDDEPLECVSVMHEVQDVITVRFRSPTGRPFAYKPGQFITLGVPIPGGPAFRTYTISSSPTRPDTITVTAKAQPTSIGTRWMIDHLKPGMPMKAVGPAGHFTSANHPARKYLFISAGSGITPMHSMTTAFFDTGADKDILFVNCARKPSEIIARDSLEYMAGRYDGLKVKWVVEETEPYRPWSGFQGRMNHLLMQQLAPDYMEREVFCCGPEPFMNAVKTSLDVLGFDMAHYHQESFGAPADAGPSKSRQDAADVQVVFTASGITHSTNEATSILGAAKSAGVAVPSGCNFGACGTCKLRKTSGEVDMIHNGGISDEEIAEGYILACCAYPKGDVALDI